MPSTQFAVCELGLTYLEGHLPIFGCNQPALSWALCLYPVFLLSDFVFKTVAAASLSAQLISFYKRHFYTTAPGILIGYLLMVARWAVDDHVCLLRFFLFLCSAFPYAQGVKSAIWCSYNPKNQFSRKDLMQASSTECCRVAAIVLGSPHANCKNLKQVFLLFHLKHNVLFNIVPLQMYKMLIQVHVPSCQET